MLEALIWFAGGVGAAKVFHLRPASKWFVVGVALTSAILAYHEPPLLEGKRR